MTYFFVTIGVSAINAPSNNNTTYRTNLMGYYSIVICLRIYNHKSVNNEAQSDN